MHFIWNKNHIDDLLKIVKSSHVNQLANVIEMYSNEGMPHHLLISDFHFIVDQFAVSLIDKIGYPLGDCPYWNIDRKCPLAAIDEEIKTKYKVISSIEHSHIGNWQRSFILKNGYDHGLELFVFKNIEDREAATILYTLGENYAAVN